jgi:hypothetical protein
VELVVFDLGFHQPYAMGAAMPAMTMRRRACGCAGVITVVLFSLSVCGAAEPAQENKPDSALAAMSTEELLHEGLDVCVRRVLLARDADAAGNVSQAAAEAAEYLSHIADAVRAQHGGTVPEWMAELITAESVKDCQHAFHSFLEEREAPEPTKAPPPRPRRGLGTQLPPWLAPPHE